MIKAEKEVVTLKGNALEIYKDFGYIIQDVVRKIHEHGDQEIDKYALKNFITAGVDVNAGVMYVTDPKMNKEVNAMIDEVLKSVDVVRNYIEAYAAQKRQENKDGLSGH